MIRRRLHRCFNDLQKSTNDVSFYDKLKKFKGISNDEVYNDAKIFKEVEKASIEVSEEVFKEKTLPSLQIATNVGNMYTPSLYASLCSLLCNRDLLSLCGRRVVMFSYGSGLSSAMFSLRVTENEEILKPLISRVQEAYKKLEERIEIEPEEFVRILKIREMRYNANSYEPECGIEHLFSGTYYLKKVDENFCREYGRKI